MSQTTIIRPQALQRTWDVIGANSAAEALSRPVTQPQTVDSSRYIWGGGTAGAVAAVSFGQPPAQLDLTQSARLWFFANTGSTTTLVVEVLANGQVLATTSITPGSGFSWQSVAFPQQGLGTAELSMRATVLNDGDSNIRDAYCEFPMAAGGNGNVDPRVRVVGMTDNIRPGDPQGGASSAALTAAGNETASFQVVVTATGGDITNFTVTADQRLTGAFGSIPVAAIRLYRVAYVTTLQETSDDAGPNPTGLWPDILVPVVDSVADEPRNAFPITIPSGQNRIAWVEVLVPAGLTAGDYQGSVAVTGDGLNTRVPITITVLKFDLPSTSQLASAFLTSLDEACRSLHYDVDTQGWQTLAMFVRLGLNNRVTIPTMLRLLRGGGDDERPKFEGGTDRARGAVTSRPTASMRKLFRLTEVRGHAVRGVPLSIEQVETLNGEAVQTWMEFPAAHVCVFKELGLTHKVGLCAVGKGHFIVKYRCVGTTPRVWRYPTEADLFANGADVATQVRWPAVGRCAVPARGGEDRPRRDVVGMASGA